MIARAQTAFAVILLIAAALLAWLGVAWLGMLALAVIRGAAE